MSVGTVIRTSVAVVVFLTTLAARAQNIVFADAAVKARCVANWDSDGDGELSQAEAAAVTSLGSVFREAADVTVFEELSSFTGLTAIGDEAFYMSTIERVTFPPTVTRIGVRAFQQSHIGAELVIPGTVKTIDDYAFYACRRLTAVVLADGVERVGWHTFSGPIKKLVLPASIIELQSMAIDPYVNADTSSGLFVPDGDLWVYARAAQPAVIDDFAFYYVFHQAHLTVPAGSIAAYQAVKGWSRFGEYFEAGDSNGDGSIDLRDLVLISALSRSLGADGLDADHPDGHDADFTSGLNADLPEGFNVDLADFNGDGRVDSLDVAAVKTFLSDAPPAPATGDVGDIWADDVTVEAGDTTTITFRLDDPQQRYCAALFDVELPDGVVVLLDRITTASDVMVTDGITVTRNPESGYCRFLVCDSLLAPLGDGVIVTLPVAVSDQMVAATYTGQVSNISLADPHGQGYVGASTTFRLTVNEPVSTAVPRVQGATGRASSHTYYNMTGQRVGPDYRGIVVQDGRKVLRP